MKSALRCAAPRPICSITDLYREALSNGRNDISSLIREGWGIAKDFRIHPECNDDLAHTHYALTYDPERQSKQLALGVAS